MGETAIGGSKSAVASKAPAAACHRLGRRSPASSGQNPSRPQRTQTMAGPGPAMAPPNDSPKPKAAMTLDRLPSHLALCLLIALAPALGHAACSAANPNPGLEEATPSANFADNADGTVTDAKTGLTWKRCSEGQTWNGTTCTGSATPFAWDGALLGARNAGFAGLADWRLPNANELQAIVESCGYAPSINDTVFPATPALGFWSSTTSQANSANGWTIDFSSGAFNAESKTNVNYVRLVRDGQSFAEFDAVSGGKKLGIASVNGGNSPTAGVAFNVAVTSSSVVAADTAVTLLKNLGSGSLGGTGSCTIPAGNNGCTLASVTWSGSESGIRLAANAEGFVSGLSSPFSVGKSSPTLLLTGTPNPSVYGSALTLTATLNGGTDPGGTIDFKDNGTSIGGCAARIVSAGSATCVTSQLSAGAHANLTASYSGDGSNNGAVSNALSQTVTKATPAIVWATPAPIAHGIALSATQLNATTGVAGSFSYAPAAGTVLGVGTHTLSTEFTPADPLDYNSATATVSLNVTLNTPPTANAANVGKAQVGQTLTGSYVYNDAENDAQDTSSTGTAYRFVRSRDNNLATTGDNADVASGSTDGVNKIYIAQAADLGKYLFYCVTPKAATGTSPGNEFCSNATSVVVGISNPGPWDQSIAFDPAPALAVGGSGTIGARASSGLPVTLANNTPDVCTLSGNTVSALAVGTCTVTGDQPGNGDYYPANQAVLNIVVGKGNQTIVLGAAPGLTVGATADVSGTASSGLPVSFSSTTVGVCTVSGRRVTGVTSGTCTIAADQPGNSNFNAAPRVLLNVTVGKASSTTTLTASSAIPGLTGQATTLTVLVSGSAGTPTGNVVFKDAGAILGTTMLNPQGNAIYAGNLSAGVHNLTASYLGDAAYLPSEGNLSHRVNSAIESVLTLRTHPNPSRPGEGVTLTVSLVPTHDVGTMSGAIEINGNGQRCIIILPEKSCTLVFADKGVKTLTASYGGDIYYSSQSGSGRHFVGTRPNLTPTIILLLD